MLTRLGDLGDLLVVVQFIIGVIGVARIRDRNYVRRVEKMLGHVE